jgi:TolA-binding protein
MPLTKHYPPPIRKATLPKESRLTPNQPDSFECKTAPRKSTEEATTPTATPPSTDKTPLILTGLALLTSTGALVCAAIPLFKKGETVPADLEKTVADAAEKAVTKGMTKLQSSIQSLEAKLEELKGIIPADFNQQLTDLIAALKTADLTAINQKLEHIKQQIAQFESHKPAPAQEGDPSLESEILAELSNFAEEIEARFNSTYNRESRVQPNIRQVEAPVLRDISREKLEEQRIPIIQNANPQLSAMIESALSNIPFIFPPQNILQELLRELLFKGIPDEESLPVTRMEASAHEILNNLNTEIRSKLNEKLPYDIERVDNRYLLLTEILLSEKKNLADLLEAKPNKEGIFTALNELLEDASTSNFDAKLTALVDALLAPPKEGHSGMMKPL